jgi:hypothetical protein
MDKKPLIGVSILALVLLVLGSLSNVVGYQTVQTSQQNVINERINQKELLFQTIVDIANNKEIQRIILKSQMSRGIFPTSEMPVLTKSQLKGMYVIGLLLSKVISKSRIQSMAGKHQFSNHEMQKEIFAVIEKDATINGEITQLQNFECDCGNTAKWSFPILCIILFPLLILTFLFWAYTQSSYFLNYISSEMLGGMLIIGTKLNCFWGGLPPISS